MSDQVERPSEVLARQVKKWRDRRKLSAQALADRIADLGGSLSRLAISKIENGARGVSVDEWLQLAHALAVPPPLLLFDLESGSDVAIAPAAVLHPWLAWEWVVGNEPPIMTNRTVTRVEEFGRAKRAIWLYQQEQRAAEAVHRAESDLDAAEYTGNEDAARAAREARVEALRELAKVLDQMVEHDMNPPAKPRSWVETMRSVKLLKYPDKVSIFQDDQVEPDGER